MTHSSQWDWTCGLQTLCCPPGVYSIYIYDSDHTTSSQTQRLLSSPVDMGDTAAQEGAARMFPGVLYYLLVSGNDRQATALYFFFFFKQCKFGHSHPCVFRLTMCVNNRQGTDGFKFPVRAPCSVFVGFLANIFKGEHFLFNLLTFTPSPACTQTHAPAHMCKTGNRQRLVSCS